MELYVFRRAYSMNTWTDFNQLDFAILQFDKYMQFYLSVARLNGFEKKKTNENKSNVFHNKKLHLEGFFVYFWQCLCLYLILVYFQLKGWLKYHKDFFFSQFTFRIFDYWGKRAVLKKKHFFFSRKRHPKLFGKSAIKGKF